MQRWRCPIHNGTQTGFVWSSMNKIPKTLTLKTNYFQSCFLYKSDLRIFTLIFPFRCYYQDKNPTYIGQSLNGLTVNPWWDFFDRGFIEIWWTLPLNLKVIMAYIQVNSLNFNHKNSKRSFLEIKRFLDGKCLNLPFGF